VALPAAGLAVVAVCVAWFGIVLDFVIPAISGHPYHYWEYPGLGRSWPRATLTLVEKPWRGLTLAVDNGRKVLTLLASFGAWLFLPLASPLVLVAIPALAERFWAHDPAFWTTRYQYTLPVAPVLAFAAVDGARRLRRHARVLVAAMATVSLVLTAFFVRPLAGFSRYMSAGRAALADSCLDRIPPTAPVAASQRLIPHLSHRLDIRPLAREQGETYLAVADDRVASDQSLLASALAGHRLGPERTRYRLVCRRGGVTVLGAARS
jgi:uncharacterized membrane protein